MMIYTTMVDILALLIDGAHLQSNNYGKSDIDSTVDDGGNQKFYFNN